MPTPAPAPRPPRFQLSVKAVVLVAVGVSLGLLGWTLIAPSGMRATGALKDAKARLEKNVADKQATRDSLEQDVVRLRGDGPSGQAGVVSAARDALGVVAADEVVMQVPVPPAIHALRDDAPRGDGPRGAHGEVAADAGTAPEVP